MDDADKYVMRQQIAAILDHPSVYMGGPSQQSIRKAIRIVEILLKEYEIQPRKEAAESAASVAAANVRTWRKSPWDSLERV